MNLTALEHVDQYYQHRVIQAETPDDLRREIDEYREEGFRAVAMTWSPTDNYVVILQRPGITRDEEPNDNAMRYR